MALTSPRTSTSEANVCENRAKQADFFRFSCRKRPETRIPTNNRRTRGWVVKRLPNWRCSVFIHPQYRPIIPDPSSRQTLDGADESTALAYDAVSEVEVITVHRRVYYGSAVAAGWAIGPPTMTWAVAPNPYSVSECVSHLLCASSRDFS
jgi:hypothetical protein